VLSVVRKGCRAFPESVRDAVMILAALLGHADKRVGRVDQILSRGVHPFMSRDFLFLSLATGVARDMAQLILVGPTVFFRFFSLGPFRARLSEVHDQRIQSTRRRAMTLCFLQ